MNTKKQGKASKIILFLLLVLFVIAILALPFGLKFMTIPEQIFLLWLIVFFLIYTKVFAGYAFVNTLLDLVDKGEDVFDHLKNNLSKESLLKALEEGSLMVLTETQFLKVQEMSSSLFDLSLVYLFAMLVAAISGILPMPVFYAATLPAVIVIVLAWLIELYIDVKFYRVFEQEIAEIESLARALNLENQLEGHLEETDEAQEVEETEDKNEEKVK